MTNSDIVVRWALPHDQPALVEYNLRLARETEATTLDRETVSRGVQALFEHPVRGRYVVAAAGADPTSPVVGQLLITHEWSDWRNGDRWWLQSVYVAHEWRGRGVFRSLVEFVRQAARDAGDVVSLRLYVEQQNAPAKATYARLGFLAPGYDVLELPLGDTMRGSRDGTEGSA